MLLEIPVLLMILYFIALSGFLNASKSSRSEVYLAEVIFSGMAAYFLIRGIVFVGFLAPAFFYGLFVGEAMPNDLTFSIAETYLDIRTILTSWWAALLIVVIGGASVPKPEKN